MSGKKKYRIDFLYRPGTTMSDTQALKLVKELRYVAGGCFDVLPEYQCLLPDREALFDKVIVVARRPDGRAGAFTSTVLIPVEGVGEVMHMGLTCVHPEDRGQGLTHKLSFKLMTQYILKHRGVREFWISNVACVLSSLGSIALNFGNVYPSPYNPNPPSDQHLQIARTIDRYYRKDVAINDDAVFDPKHFVFRGSVRGGPFHKSTRDKSFYHRYDEVNDFYNGIMDIDNGDEVIQVGTMGPRAVLSYIARRRKSPRAYSRPNTASNLHV